jgi:hypothetical protein
MGKQRVVVEPFLDIAGYSALNVNRWRRVGKQRVVVDPLVDTA